MSIVTGILSADAGGFSWFGQGNSPILRQQTGSLIEVPHFYPYLSLQDNLRLISAIKGHGAEDINRVLSLTRLETRKKSRFSALSLGMKQRLGIAAALLGDPEVLILDEPTNGLDPEGIAEVRELIKDQAGAGKTIIMASHILNEVEKVCTHVAIMKKGRIIEQGSVTSLLGNENLVEVNAADNEKLHELLKSCPFVSSLNQSVSGFQVLLEEGKNPEDLNRYIFENGVSLGKIISLKKSLETQFLELVKDQS